MTKKLQTLASRLRALFGQSRAESEFADEIEEHIRLLAERSMSRGMSREDAIAAARRQFGNAPLLQQRQRERRTFTLFSDLWRDALYGLRMLGKRPLSTAAIVIALALGIGMNTCVFTFVNAMLLRPPAAVQSPGELRELWEHSHNSFAHGQYLPLSYPDYTYFRDHAKSFTGLLAYDPEPEAMIWNNAGSGEVIRGSFVSGNFFSLAGVGVALGRVISPADDQPDHPQPLAVLGNSFWRKRFGGDPGVLGKTLMLNGVNFTVIGVAPAGFNGFIIGITPDVWAPLSITGQAIRDSQRLTSRNTNWLIAEGRLAPGATTKSALAEMNLLAREIELAHPDTNKNRDAAVFTLAPVPGPVRGYVTAFTGLLLTVFALVLVIACTNAASLLLVRSTGRAREMAIRSALGAGRGRLMRQMTVESLLLSLMAGCAAMVLARWTARLLLTLIPPSLPVSIQLPMDWRVVSFTFLAALITGLAFGALPAMRGTRVDPVRVLRNETQAGGYQKSRLRNLLMIGEVAICALLLFGATLCVRSLLNASSIDPGFDTRNIATATLDPGSLGYSEEKLTAFYRDLIARVRAMPGVTSASYTSLLPLDAGREETGVLPENRTDWEHERRSVDVYRVAPRYFETMRIPLLGGRDFTQSESDNNENVIVVNEAFARSLWNDRNPVGQWIKVGTGDANTRMQVIGVTKTGKYRTLGELPIPVIYRLQLPPRRVIVIHTAASPAPMLDALRREVRLVDPNIAPTEMQTVSQFMAFPMFPARVTGLLLGASGILALVLTWIGLFGVISVAVSQRTREIGVRMALGARRQDVLRLVMRQGMFVTGIGLVIGIGAGLAATRLLSSLLYGIRPDDPATLVAVSLGLLFVAGLACYLPARRAMRVNPTTALRYE